jgi:hypothetical protein
MQQRLAVASVLVLALLAGSSALLIQTHASNTSQPNGPTQTQSTHTQVTTNTNSTSPGGSLLTGGNPTQTGYGDDGNETEHEIETEYSTNSTLDS